MLNNVTGNSWELINRGFCPFGGKCTDTEFPTDCSINSTCFNFSSIEEKAEYDALPYLYFYWSPRLSLSLFKTDSELEFFISRLFFPNRRGEVRGKIQDFYASNLLPDDILSRLSRLNYD